MTFLKINNLSVNYEMRRETVYAAKKVNINVEILESDIAPRINLKVLRDSYIDLSIEITLFEKAKLEILDESEYSKGSEIKINSKLEQNSSFELYRLNRYNKSTENKYYHKCEL